MFREAGMQVSPVTMSHPSPGTAALPCLPLDIKDSLKENWGVAFALDLLLEAFAFGLLLFWVKGGFWKGELLKGNC
jgi:hypothetical protein